VKLAATTSHHEAGQKYAENKVLKSNMEEQNTMFPSSAIIFHHLP
jgi:hypothetical protein